MSPRMFARCSALCALLAACARAPQPAAPAAPSEHSHAARSERKPSSGAHVALSLSPLGDGSVELAVELTTQQPIDGATLRVELDDDVTVSGAREWTLPALTPGASARRTCVLRRGAQRPFGSFVTVTLASARDGERLREAFGAWAFGEPDPARVLPRSGLDLGAQGLGPLGPREAVIRTPEGERLHETRVR